MIHRERKGGREGQRADYTRCSLRQWASHPPEGPNDYPCSLDHLELIAWLLCEQGEFRYYIVRSPAVVKTCPLRAREELEETNGPGGKRAVETDEAMQGVIGGQNIIGHLFPTAIGCGCSAVSHSGASRPKGF